MTACARPFGIKGRCREAPKAACMKHAEPEAPSRRTTLHLGLALGETACCPLTGTPVLCDVLLWTATISKLHLCCHPKMWPGRDSGCASLAGMLAAQPLAAKAITVPECDQLTTAGNGIHFCDTREGTGKTPAKGALIR